MVLPSVYLGVAFANTLSVVVLWADAPRYGAYDSAEWSAVF